MDNSIFSQGLGVGYGKDNIVLDGLSFSINPGEIVCLIGANGAGKSTVLKTIVRQLKKLSGSIVINGLREDEMSEADVAKHVSMVMTERIHPELMSCYDVVATGRFPYTGRLGILTDSDKAAIEQALNLVGAENIAYKDFSKISDGQRQRIMLARAICQDTEVMVLDEPTSFLDLQYKLDILKVIKKMAKTKNMAVLMSIHELEFVPGIADKVIGIVKNGVYLTGTPKEVLTGENIQKMYGMPLDNSNILCLGLWKYADAIVELLECQK